MPSMFFDAFTVFARLSVPFCQCEISKAKDADMLPRKMSTLMIEQVAQVQAVLSSISSLADPRLPLLSKRHLGWSSSCERTAASDLAEKRLREFWLGCLLNWTKSWILNRIEGQEFDKRYKQKFLLPPKLQQRGLVFKCKLVTVIMVCVVNVVL